jgi:arabinofuranan 3-O-arabinosyltransferase
MRDAPAAIIPEQTVGTDFWARCRALERSCYTGDDLIEAARFFRREAFKSVGGFDEQLVAGEDWDLSIRTAGRVSLPRISSVIYHDETGLTLRERLSKKRYYANSMMAYWRKHKRSGLRQANVILRPALLRNWRKLKREPLLLSGILVLKTLELLASVAGVLTVVFGNRSGAPNPEAGVRR